MQSDVFTFVVKSVRGMTTARKLSKVVLTRSPRVGCSISVLKVVRSSYCTNLAPKWANEFKWTLCCCVIVFPNSQPQFSASPLAIERGERRDCQTPRVFFQEKALIADLGRPKGWPGPPFIIPYIQYTAIYHDVITRNFSRLTSRQSQSMVR